MMLDATREAAFDLLSAVIDRRRPLEEALDALPEMPLFLEPNGCVQAPLDATYQTAFAAMPRRWRRVLAPTA